MSVAVVVPAHTEAAGVALLLSSIAALTEPPRVVVAVDGGDPVTVAAAQAGGAEVVVLPVNGGSYAARNAALEHLLADGVPDVVLFTDADCVVTPGWVEHHVAALAGAELSAGGVRFTYRRRRPSPAEWVDSVRHLQQEHYVTRDGFGATCNLAVRGDLLVTQRFDSTLRTGGDAEFCRRVVASGARLVYTPQAGIEHPARDLRELWIKVDRLVTGVPRQAQRWASRPLPPRRLTRGVWRRAQRAGHPVGPVWGVAACVLDWALSMRVRRAVLRLGVHR